MQFDALPSRAGVLPVRSHAAESAQLNGLQGAVVVDGHLVVLNGWPTAMDADEVVLPRVFEASPGRRLFASIAVMRSASWFWFLLPKLPPISQTTPDLFVGDTEVARNVVAAVGDTARRRNNRQLVAVPVSHARASGSICALCTNEVE